MRGAELLVGGFTDGIEGLSCDRDGRIYAVDYLAPGTIGQVTPEGRARVCGSTCRRGVTAVGRSGALGANCWLRTTRATTYFPSDRTTEPLRY